MIATISQIIILIFAVAIFVICVLSIYSPNKLIKVVKTAWDKDWGIYAGVIVRLFLGASLILAAAGTRFPVVFKILGEVSIVAALVLAIVGRDRISRLMAWFEHLPSAIIRLWLMFGLAFSGFLIYCIL